MKLEAEIKNIKKILVDDEKFYQIPDYQRPYAWDKDNLSDLIDDLVNAYLNDKNSDYFCGSLVLVDNKQDRRLDIIDGQQRTTTFTILSCVFRDIYSNILNPKVKDYIHSSIQDKYDNDKRKLRFLTNDKYQIDFEETVLKKINFQDSKNIEKSFPNNRYLQNAHYLKNFLIEKIDDNTIDINEFIIWFFENVVLTVITCPSQNDAIQIFNVLNNRGMPLSTIDILKSSLMQTLENEDRKAFKSKWEEINLNLQFVDLSLEDMLTTYLYYKIAMNPQSRLDKELLAIFEKEKKNSLEILKEISNFSVAYIKVVNLEDKHIYCLKYLKHKIYWTSILTTAEFFEYKDLEKLKELLVAYYYQNWISGATIARIKQTSFNILKLVKENQAIDEIKKEMNRNLTKYSTTETFHSEIAGSYVYGRNWDKALLLLIEYFSSENGKNNFININSKLQLEHILPQNPDGSWKKIFSDDDRDGWTNALANLTLLSMRKNVQAQNYSFDRKKQTYQDKDNVVTPFLVTQDILKCDKWDIEALVAREERLIRKINEKINIF
jgi:uncharacterized protein with ParB-like and HNH nuclease domain